MAGTDERSGGAVAVRSPRSRPGELRSWILFGAIAVAAWELASRLYAQPFLLPAPSQIAAELADNWDLVLAYAWITTQEVVVGFTLGLVTALLAAMLPRPRRLAVREEVAFFQKVREGREALREA